MQGMAYPPPFHKVFLLLFTFWIQILIGLLARVKNILIVTVVIKGPLYPIWSVAHAVIVCWTHLHECELDGGDVVLTWLWWWSSDFPDVFSSLVVPIKLDRCLIFTLPHELSNGRLTSVVRIIWHATHILGPSSSSCMLVWCLDPKLWSRSADCQKYFWAGRHQWTS